ncbi:peptidase M10 [Archangium violaceum]|uniref:peptidase M10 n=1 Tax=Archangium violaceum TaxID=83451 RepID=UPI00190F8B10|nr:peptidase M10 [Archangium violaceum]
MRNLRLAAALAGLTALAATGCSGPEEQLDPGPVGQGITWEEFRAQAHVDPEGVFIVDGDVALHDEARLREYFERYVKSGQLMVHTSGGVDVKWNDTQKRNLTYCVSTSGFNSIEYGLVVQALSDAASAWEAVADVNFVHESGQDTSCTASNTNVVFDVRLVSSGGLYYVRSFFPDAPRGARNILIDPLAFGPLAPPLSLTGLLRHELGHVLGFGHEHLRPEANASTLPGCAEAAPWRALTQYDSGSVMHFPSCNGTGNWSFTLTTLDAQGAAALYGQPGTQEPPGPGPGTPTTETVSGALDLGQDAHHGPYDVVPNSYFKVVMTGSGNPDLYVSFGSAPTDTGFYCRPGTSTASETCNVLVPANQTKAHIMVKGLTTASYALDIDYLKPSTGGPTLETTSGSLSSSAPNAYHGPYDVIAGTYFKVVMTGTGNPNLFVNFGTTPTTNSFYCRPALSGANETCDVLVPEGQTKAYIMVRSTSTATYSLNITYTKPSATGGPATAAVNGSLSSGQSANHGPYDVVTNSYFKVVMTGSGNPDLYVGFGTAPTTNSFYCRPALSGASETCNVLVPPNETKAYVMVKGVNSSTYALDITYTRP